MKLKLALISVLAIAALALAGCIGPSTVENEAPIAAITYAQNGLVFDFSSMTSIDVDGTIDKTTCVWWFGDGKSASNMKPVHTYDGYGTYTVRMVLYDNDGARGEDTCAVTIKEPLVEVEEWTPVALFTCTPQQTQTGSEVAFNGIRSYDIDGHITYGRWDFGDGKHEQGAWLVGCGSGNCIPVTESVTHSYDKIGYYTILLTVTDNDGNKSSTTRTILVK